MPRIDLDILNQKQTPAFYASSLATRPAASFVGRIFIDSDSPSTGLYRDTGTAWVQIADPGAGTTGTLQQVTTNGNTTNIGISVTANGIGIGVAAPAANILDIHGTTGVLAQLENTTTQNSLLSFRNQGAGVWSIGNGYNAGANNFIVYDAVSFINRLTIKATGQTFIGADTTSSGLFVVNSATSDNHIVILGANAPSLRFRNAGTGGSLNAGVGISTATNNFIQGSASGDYCIFNSSTTASPIIFGIYNGTNTQEAGRISAARNLLLGITTDTVGQKFYCNGNAYVNGNLTGTGLLTFGVQLFKAGQQGVTGFLRWAWETASSETGGDAGSNLVLYNYNDSGVIIGTIYNINRATGATVFNYSLTTPSLNIYTATDTNFFIGGVNTATNNPRVFIKVSESTNTVFIQAGSSTGSDILAFSNAGNVNLSIKNSGVVNIRSTSVYATNALALAGGLVAGDIYKSATGVLSIVF